MPDHRYHWARPGDVNAFFGLMLDNVAVMVLLVGALVSSKPGFTPEFVLVHMIPGTALGVLFGDLVYTWMAFRLARRTGKNDVTAMPLGLDTPSTFGVAYLVLLPVLQEKVPDLGQQDAMFFAWHVGLVVLVLIGLAKVIFAPLGNLVRQLVPRAGLLGSLAAIALVLIAFLPMLQEIGAVPLVGMVALTVILVALVAHKPLPGKVPGALAAVILGVAIYWIGRFLEERFGYPLVPPSESDGALKAMTPAGLMPFLTRDAAWWGDVLLAALAKLPVALPFALATIVGGIDCTESAAAAGDEYDTRGILLTEGLTSVAAGCLGGVIQTTPYIGHPAYKAMGGRAAYTLATALFIGLMGYLGWFGYLFAWLPKAAMFPILVFVGLEITAESFRATPTRHYAALALAVLPALAALVIIPLNMAFGGMTPNNPHGLVVVQTLRCLANGFIVTSLLWAAALAALIDSHYVRSALWLIACAGFTLIGVIHSPLPDAAIGLPDRVLAQVPAAFQEAVRYQTPYHWLTAYLLAAVVLLVLSTLARAVVDPETRHPRGEP